ncbi:MAG: hypothetical protein IKI40_10330, partial [Treponema sp.]|nr:hypothetical protein [Treponema sp.]
MKRIIGRISFLFILILSLGLISCDSWMTGDNFFDQIADEVKYANAEKIKVYVRYPTTTWGTTSPNGNSQQKVDIPFSVTAVDNSEYGFYKWAAFSTTGDDGYSTANGRHNIQLIESEAKFEEQYGAKVLGEDEVVFEDPYSPTTIVRVLNNRNDVFIMPICVRRPFLSSTMPSNNQVGAAKNTTIQLVFSNPMNPAFLLFDSADHPYESNTTDVIEAYLNTSNISVEQVLSSGENPYNADITGKLRDINGNLHTGTVKLSASLNKSRKTLTIKLPSSLYWPNGTIMVSVSQTVQDNLGFTMSSDGQVTFNVGNDMDTEPPKVLGLEAGTTTLIDNRQADVYPRVGKTINIRAVITDQTELNGTASEGNVNTLDYWMYWNDTQIESGNQTYSPAVNFTEVVSYPKAELTASQRGRGVVFPYTFTHTNIAFDGMYTLVVRGVDNVGNEGNISNPVKSTDYVTEAPSRFINFIKDTQAPYVNSSQIVATANGNGAPYGWFNSSTISNITIKESSAGTIVDRPSSDGVYGSENVWWTFYMGSDFTTWSNNVKPESDSWSLVSSTGVPLSTLIGSNIDTSAVVEGDVLLYAKFRDDVGNISDLVSLDAIKFDGTNPTLGDLSWTSKNSSVAPGIADSNVLGNQQLVVPFTENLSGIKKIKVTVVDPDGDEYETPFRNTDFAIRTSPSGELLPGSVDATDGTYYIFNTPVVSTTFTSLYIDNLKISESSTLAEGNYTVKVKLFDAALNETAEKTISLYADST